MSNNFEKLQPASHDVLAFLIAHEEEHGFAPTFREIAAGCYIAIGTVAYHLSLLEAYGWIERVPGRTRCIRLLRPAPIEDNPTPPEN